MNRHARQTRQQERSSTGRDADRRRVPAPGLAALAIAAFAIAALAACGGKPADTGSTSIRQTAPLPAPPSIGVTPEAPPVVPAAVETPVAPPTVEETRVAWKEGVRQFESRDYEAAAGSLQIAATGRPDDSGVHYLHGLAL